MLDAGLGGRGITAPEKVVVIKFVIKVVENLAKLEAWVERINGVVSLIEGRRESAEHVGEGQIGFPVSIITRRIIDERRSLFVHCCVSAPQVSMKKGRVRGITFKECGKVFQKLGASLKTLPLALGQVKLVAKSMVRVKGNPVFATGVGLRGCPDAVVPMPAEKRLLDLVESCQLGA